MSEWEIYRARGNTNDSLKIEIDEDQKAELESVYEELEGKKRFPRISDPYFESVLFGNIIYLTPKDRMIEAEDSSGYLQEEHEELYGIIGEDRFKEFLETSSTGNEWNNTYI